MGGRQVEVKVFDRVASLPQVKGNPASRRERGREGEKYRKKRKKEGTKESPYVQIGQFCSARIHSMPTFIAKSSFLACMIHPVSNLFNYIIAIFSTYR